LVWKRIHSPGLQSWVKIDESFLRQVVYDLQKTGIVRWKKGPKRPAVIVLGIPTIPNLKVWAMENLNRRINLAAKGGGGEQSQWAVAVGDGR